MKLIEKLRERYRKRIRCNFDWTVEQQDLLRETLGRDRYEWLIDWLRLSDPLERVICLLSSMWLQLMLITVYVMTGTVLFALGLPEHIVISFIGLLIFALFLAEIALVVMVVILGWKALARKRKRRKVGNEPA